MTDIVDGRYRLDEQLAVGGFGTVYRAMDLQLGRAVALKVLHRELARDASIVARFRREAAALAKLKSPHTLTIYDIGQSADSLYMVMELLRGESLDHVLARTGAMPWRRVARLARGVCSSLREAHAIGIVHRDLKPANIFLERHVIAGELVKVVDFGIAKSTTTTELTGIDITLHGQTIGTFDYMAPEQLVGETCSTACDVFTLGVVLYELLAGVRPFAGARNPAQMLVALATQHTKPLASVPGALARIVAQCLERDPSDRPSIAQVDAVLEHLLVGDLATMNAATNEATVVTVVEGPGPIHGMLATPARMPQAALIPAFEARGALVPVVRARGSESALAFAPTVATTAADVDDDAITAVTPPPVHESAPRLRLASGTTGPSLPTVTPLPTVGATELIRILTIAACLFALGFVLALALW